MVRVILIHFGKSDQGEIIARLERANLETRCLRTDDGVKALRSIARNKPDAVVINLDKLPSHGRAVAVALRQQKSTRLLPIVFVAGDAEKVTSIKEILPDATYCNWRNIRAAVNRAVSKPIKSPLVPGTMGAYSATPMFKKLGIKKGHQVALLGAPGDLQKHWGDIVHEITIKRQARGNADLIMLFCNSSSEFDRRLPAALNMMSQRAGLWIAWTKKASGMKSDLSQKEVRAKGFAAGLVDYKIASIDDTWSGLKFARRKRR